MRTHRLLLLLAGLVIPAAAAEPALTVRPVQMISLADVPNGAPDEAKSVMFTKGFSIGYLVEGQDLIGVVDDSLDVEITSPDGKSLSKKRNGEKSYKLGSFPKATDDGKYLFFQLESEEHDFGRIESLVVTGTVTVRTGSDLTNAATKAHGLTSKEVEQAGEFKVAFGEESGGKVSFGGEAGAESVSITISGPLEKLTKVALKVDGKAVHEEGYMGMHGADSRTYQFEKPAGASGTIELSYWKNLAETKLAIGAKK
jgi:hypothetical protein